MYIYRERERGETERQRETMIDIGKKSFLSFPLYIWCLNIYGTHVTANNSTNINVAFFLFSG